MTQASRGNVFITGAATGIGAATAEQLVQAGYQVFAGMHQQTSSVASGPRVRAITIDVTDPGSVAAAAKVVAEAVGPQGLQAVINNAGVIVQGPLELVPPDALRRQFEIDTFGPAHVIQAFLPLLRAGHGRIINISAPTARVPVPFMAPIGASKAALASLSDSLRLELARWNIPVVVIEPGGTDTAIFRKAEAAAEGALASADPAKVALYSSQLAAVATAAAKQKLVRSPLSRRRSWPRSRHPSRSAATRPALAWRYSGSSRTPRPACASGSSSRSSDWAEQRARTPASRSHTWPTGQCLGRLGRSRPDRSTRLTSSTLEG